MTITPTRGEGDEPVCSEPYGKPDSDVRHCRADQKRDHDLELLEWMFCWISRPIQLTDRLRTHA